MQRRWTYERTKNDYLFTFSLDWRDAHKDRSSVGVFLFYLLLLLCEFYTPSYSLFNGLRCCYYYFYVFRHFSYVCILIFQIFWEAFRWISFLFFSSFPFTYIFIIGIIIILYNFLFSLTLDSRKENPIIKWLMNSILIWHVSFCYDILPQIFLSRHGMRQTKYVSTKKNKYFSSLSSLLFFFSSLVFVLGGRWAVFFFFFFLYSWWDARERTWECAYKVATIHTLIFNNRYSLWNAFKC